MTNLPRWKSDFTTNPLSNPAYGHSNQVFYNATNDRVEIGGNAANELLQEFIKINNSKNSSGIVTLNSDLFPNGNISGSGKIYIKCFGYYFVFFQGHSGPTSQALAAFNEEQTGWMIISLDSDPYGLQAVLAQGALVRLTSGFSGPRDLKIVSDAISTRFYFDGSLLITLPIRNCYSDTEAGVCAKATSNEHPELWLYTFDVMSDASLPLASDFLSSSNLVLADQKVEFSVPEARLFIDLSSYSNIEGLSNVVFDPIGDNIAMTEDTTGQSGDFYLEIPFVNELSSSKKLVLKEAFVIAHSVTTSDAIQFNVLPSGPTAELKTIKQLEGLQFILEKNSVDPSFQAGMRPLLPNNTNFALHNIDADGNSIYLSESSQILLNDNYSGNTVLSYSSGFTFPIILDLDLLKWRRIVGILGAYSTNEGSHVQSADLYTKSTPFVGGSLGQGTLVFDNYPIAESFNGITLPWREGVFGFFPETLIDTRYLRIVINANNTNYASGVFKLFRQLYFQTKDTKSINSVNQNAAFKVDLGSGFVAFPSAGVTQNSGVVQVTLPSELQLTAGQSAYMSVRGF